MKLPFIINFWDLRNRVSFMNWMPQRADPTEFPARLNGKVKVSGVHNITPAGCELIACEYQSARVRAMFRRLLQREPSQSEAVAAKRFLAQYPGEELERWSAYTRVLMSSNEFLYVD